MNGPLFQWGGGPGVQTKLPFVYHHILSGSGRALPGWAKGPARKPGGSTGRKSTAIFCRVRPQPVCKSSPPAVNATSSDELQSAAWGGGGLRGSKSRRSSAQSKTQLTAQISAPCSARRSGKTVTGFPARRTVTAQSTAQFFAPCAPHCGSAFAPPRFRAPARFIYIRLPPK